MHGVRLLGTYRWALRTQQWTLETSRIPLGDPRIGIPPACLSHWAESPSPSWVSLCTIQTSLLYHIQYFMRRWLVLFFSTLGKLVGRSDGLSASLPAVCPTHTQPIARRTVTSAERQRFGVSLFPQGAMLIRENSINNSTPTHWGPTVCQAEHFTSILHQEATIKMNPRKTKQCH